MLARGGDEWIFNFSERAAILKTGLGASRMQGQRDFPRKGTKGEIRLIGERSFYFRSKKFLRAGKDAEGFGGKGPGDRW